MFCITLFLSSEGVKVGASSDKLKNIDFICEPETWEFLLCEPLWRKAEGRFGERKAGGGGLGLNRRLWVNRLCFETTTNDDPDLSFLSLDDYPL